MQADRNELILNLATEGFWDWNLKTDTAYLSPRYCELVGYSPDDTRFDTNFFRSIIHPDDRSRVFEIIEETLLQGKRDISIVEYRMISKDGSSRWIEGRGNIAEYDDLGTPARMVGTIQDITERKLAEVYGDMIRETLRILNEPGEIQTSIQSVLVVIKSMTGLDAVGIRLKDGEDFPYYAQEGFSSDFILAENTLVERTDGAGVCRDTHGNISLECTCGMVITGSGDNANPFLTPAGTFWTNDSFPLLGIPLSNDPRHHPRNLCIHEGYASVALVPIRNKDRIVGLIHLNDRRKGCFRPTTIELLEGLALHIGEAMMRKRDEEELQKKSAMIEQQYADLRNSTLFIENLVMQSATPIFVLDNRHQILFWNRALVKLTGLDSDQMVGTDRHWAAFYAERRPTLADLILDPSEGDVSKFYDSHGKSRLVEGALKSDGWFQFPDIGKRYLTFHASPIRNTDGEIVAVIETLEDNTETKQVESLLNEQHLFLQQVLDSLPNPVYYKDSRGAYLGCNRSFEEYFGKEKKFILGKHVADLIPSEQACRHSSYDRMCMKSNSMQTFETSLVHADGQTRQVIVTKAPLHHNSGTVNGLVGAFTDITTRKQIETALRESEEKFRSISDSAQDAIIMIDSSGLVTFWNRAAEKIFGYSKDEILGRGLHEHIAAPHMLEMFRNAFSKFQGSGQGGAVGRTIELQATRKGGGEIPVELSLSSVNLEGQWCAIGLARDITSRKEAQEVIIASQVALEAKHAELKSTQSLVVQQEKMASIGLMAAGVAHEINNPMAFISCNINCLAKYMERLREYQSTLNTYLSDCPEHSRKAIVELQRRLNIDYVLEDTGNLIKQTQDGADRVLRIVQNLKSFSRVDQTDEKYADINQCLESTINIAWNEIKYVATLRKEFNEIPLIRCFPQQLNQVFLNLLINASQAITDQGEIIVRTWHEALNIFVSISDTGSGIPENIQRSIFEPFITTKEAGKGTGLGLSISLDIVRKHGGDLTFTSQPGQGTTFTIRLPVNNVHG